MRRQRLLGLGAAAAIGLIPALVVGLPAQANTSPTFRASTDVSGTTSSLTSTAPTGTVSGDCQVAVVEVGTTSLTLGATPSGWTKQQGTTDAGGGDSYQLAVYSSTTATGSATFSLSGSGRSWQVFRSSYSNCSAIGPSAIAVRAAGTSFATPSVTTVNDGDVVQGIVGTEGTASAGQSFTAPSGWTSRLNNDVSNEDEALGVADTAVTNHGTATSGTFTATHSDNGITAAVDLEAATSGGTPAPSWNPNGTYTNTFDDEFNGTAVDTSKWELGWYLGLGNTGITQPVNSTEIACYDSANATESGGLMHLKLFHTSNTCGGSAKSYTGALVDTRTGFRQRGGSFEARVCIADDGAGKALAWPAWWQVGPDTYTWPKMGEVDHVEGLSGGTTDWHLHYIDGNNVEQDPGYESTSAKTGCHTFGDSWNTSTSTVTEYWDGVQVAQHAFLTPSDATEDLIFQNTLASVSNQPSSFPVDFQVDWVRAWSQP